jgi:uncharacterized protein (TIGR04255 family)
MPESPSHRRQYKNPPIEEAICEFRFDPDPAWDLTILGKLHERLKDEYQGKPVDQRTLAADLSQGASEGSLDMVMKGGISRLKFPTSDGTRLVSVGRNVLGVSSLRPYEGWDSLFPRVTRALEAYQEVASHLSITRVGVRYINRIVVPGSGIDLGRYFKCLPPHVPGLPGGPGNFLTRVEYSYEDEATLLLNYAAVDSPEGSSAFLLDLDVAWQADDGKRTIDEAVSLVGDLRNRERSAFEALITDDTRRLFDAG